MTASGIDTLRPALATVGRLGVAVSGGSDSLGLLHLLHDLAGPELHVVTVDHGLRPTSAGEALHVARLSEAMGHPHTTLAWTGWDGRGNLQDEARRTRYSLMAGWGLAEGLDAIALGHTMDDAAETFLMRLSRAAGIDGLSPMAARFERHGMIFLRPLLSWRRDALRDLLAARGVTWVEDPSNDDDTFDRVRARRVLDALAPLGLSAGEVAEAASHLGEARAALDAYAVRFARQHVSGTAGDLVFDRTALQGEPAEARRRLLAAALRFVSSAPYPPRKAPLDDLLAAVAERRNTALHGARVLVSDFTVRVTREHAAVASLKGPSDRPWDLRWRLDGPHAPGLEIRALGEALATVPGWRETGLPRATLLASPAVWFGERLLAAPVAGLEEGWSAHVPGCDEFISGLSRH